MTTPRIRSVTAVLQEAGDQAAAETDAEEDRFLVAVVEILYQVRQLGEEHFGGEAMAGVVEIVDAAVSPEKGALELHLLCGVRHEAANDNSREVSGTLFLENLGTAGVKACDTVFEQKLTLSLSRGKRLDGHLAHETGGSGSYTDHRRVTYQGFPDERQDRSVHKLSLFFLHYELGELRLCFDPCNSLCKRAIGRRF
jgi:hypothetical protein